MAPERSNSAGNQLRNASTLLYSGTTGFPVSGFLNPSMAQQTTATPPPVPPRPPQTQNYSGYGDYYRPFGNNYYGPLGYNAQYRGYGNYPGGYYSSGLSPYNSYGNIGAHSGDTESRFLQYAEESTRSTFQLVETVLQTFSSLTMLLESTYFAMTNSFRAILSVAENIGRLRNTIGQLLSTFALIRYLKWIYKRLLFYSVGRQHNNNNNNNNGLLEEELWERTLHGTQNESNRSGPSTLPSILMFSVFVVVPYVIHKIMNNAKRTQANGTLDPRDWTKLEEPVYTANVLYDFIGQKSDELTVRQGQKIWLAPQSLQPKNLPGWCRATDNRNVGLVPYNYVAIVGQLRRKAKADQSDGASSSPSESNKPANGFDDTN